MLSRAQPLPHAAPAPHPMPQRVRDPLYDEVRGLLKGVSGDELLAALEGAAIELVTAAERHADIAEDDLRAEAIAFDQYVATVRYRAADDELALRQRVLPPGTRPQLRADPRSDDWHALARQVRERTNCADLLTALGFSLRKVGSDPRRQGHEWAGPCPLCGGTDRLRVFDGPNGLAWCRRCGWKADAITIARSYGPDGPGFRDSIRFLLKGCLPASSDSTAPTGGHAQERE